jgi:hypothetical protein
MCSASTLKLLTIDSGSRSALPASSCAPRWKELLATIGSPSSGSASTTSPSESRIEDRWERLVERLRTHGIETDGIEVNADPQTDFVAFRDPDNIQLEYFVI